MTIKRRAHESLIVWRVAKELDELVAEIVKTLPKSEFKTISQITNASDSIGSNIVEGYYSGKLGEYIRFLRYARRSCAELVERIERINRRDLINKGVFDRFDDKSAKTGFLIDRLIKSLVIKQEKR
jgi:four helix bundle protein